MFLAEEPTDVYSEEYRPIRSVGEEDGEGTIQQTQIIYMTKSNRRTTILNLLKEGPKSVGELQDLTGYEPRHVKNILSEFYGMNLIKGTMEKEFIYTPLKGPFTKEVDCVYDDEFVLQNIVNR